MNHILRTPHIYIYCMCVFEECPQVMFASHIPSTLCTMGMTEMDLRNNKLPKVRFPNGSLSRSRVLSWQRNLSVMSLISSRVVATCLSGSEPNQLLKTSSVFQSVGLHTAKCGFSLLKGINSEMQPPHHRSLQSL